MGVTEIILVVVGVVVFLLGYLMPAKKKDLDEEVQMISEDEIRKLIAGETEKVKDRIADIVDEAVNYSIEKTERAMERLTNEKIMAINEYSDTVLEEINKNHKEVIFLYDMLNDKHDNLMSTINEATVASDEIKQALKETETAAQEAAGKVEDVLQAVSEASGRINDVLRTADDAVKGVWDAQNAARVAREAAQEAIRIASEASNSAQMPQNRQAPAVRPAAASRNGQAAAAARAAASRSGQTQGRPVAGSGQEAVARAGAVPRSGQAQGRPAAGSGQEAVARAGAVPRSGQAQGQPAADSGQEAAARAGAASQSGQAVPAARTAAVQEPQPRTQRPAAPQAAAEKDAAFSAAANPAEESGAARSPVRKEETEDGWITAADLMDEVAEAPVFAELEQEPETEFKPIMPKKVEVIHQPETETEQAGDKDMPTGVRRTVEDNTPAVDIQFTNGPDNGRNSNERILELHKAGKSNMAIAKELGLGLGEVKLVIDLFEGM